MFTAFINPFKTNISAKTSYVHQLQPIFVPQFFGLRFSFLCYFFTYWYRSTRKWRLKSAHPKNSIHQPHKEHHWIWMWTTLLWWSILVHTKFLTRMKYLRVFIACTSTWISSWSNKPNMYNLYHVFAFHHGLSRFVMSWQRNSTVILWVQ